MQVGRRQVLLAGGLAAGGLAAGGLAAGGLEVERHARRDEARPGIAGELVGADAGLGHRLREGGLPPPSSASDAGVVIVGGGMAGLSAAWRLERAGVKDVVLLEMDRAVGGNASSGRNAVSGYPWGAHYVPLLTRDSVHAAELFEELGVITGRNARGEPIYNEFHLCADGRERLYDQGRWQEDLLPTIGAGAEDRRQYQAFADQMAAYRTARGSDGRRAFTIPLDLSSADERYRALDAVSMTDWMAGRGWDSAPLAWYVDYCMRDDYGTHARHVSAWAGVHYFASRDGKGAEDDTQTVLTWPEGNGWIVGELKRRLRSSLVCRSLAWRVRPGTHGVEVDVFDADRGESRTLAARTAILATPGFVADRLLSRPSAGGRSYAPWMVANVTVSRVPGGRGVPLCWDNVFRDSASLGYVVATHQSLETAPGRTVLTHYWPLCDGAPEDERRAALGRSLGDWHEIVLRDLLRVHPELEGCVERIDVCVWGHAMVRPTPGYIWGEARAAACAHAPPVFFAHSDMSGISIFEEANFRGVQAADAVAEFLRT